MVEQKKQHFPLLNHQTIIFVGEIPSNHDVLAMFQGLNRMNKNTIYLGKIPSNHHFLLIQSPEIHQLFHAMWGPLDS